MMNDSDWFKKNSNRQMRLRKMSPEELKPPILEGDGMSGTIGLNSQQLLEFQAQMAAMSVEEPPEGYEFYTLVTQLKVGVRMRERFCLRRMSRQVLRALNDETILALIK